MRAFLMFDSFPVLAASSAYEIQKAREIAQVTDDEHALEYFNLAFLPLAVIVILVMLVRRGGPV
ncbi:MAG: hypothetical protein HS117_14625 [Verrucomicrobiaceae bacterium]|jgi:hypothetical protein|nr:hypothetical protein [Verrucomicrobiaceae bacterium]